MWSVWSEREIEGETWTVDGNLHDPRKPAKRTKQLKKGILTNL